ncbi:hypothetical protein AZ66_08880, partial [Paenibacillus sp. E194]|uniref:FAD-dependent oxidoreductase n=1 Tax=Paenibacillus sp. E194 TaxID=1458845 RepID=UPI0005C891A7
MRKKATATMILLLSIMLIIAGCGSNGNKTQGQENAAKTEKPETEAVSGASKASYTPIDQLKDKYDIIIIGAGGAGMTAALEAKAKGMNPVIFEKMPAAGGNTMKSSSGMNASQTKFQKEQGIQDNNDLFFEQTLKGGHGTNDKEMLRYFVDNSASAIDWLDSIGIRLEQPY